MKPFVIIYVLFTQGNTYFFKKKLHYKIKNSFYFNEKIIYICENFIASP